MQPLGVWWAVAGGWAIDLWLGARTREHHDVEIVVRREDQAVVHGGLRDDWELGCRSDSGWRPWGDDEQIVAPSFQLKASRPPIEFDIFLESTIDDTWIFRRDARVQRGLADVVTISESGIPVVSPEIQLLYMAKSDEPKNQHDFERARRRLPDDAASWLSETLAMLYPLHPWLAQLS